MNNGVIDSTLQCKKRWVIPSQTALPFTSGSQTGPYWNNSLTRYTDDCFKQTSPGVGDNAFACCYSTTYNNKEYGDYKAVDASSFKKVVIA